jgi:hypothetical protein
MLSGVTETLLTELLHAEEVQEVEQALKRHGYLDDSISWRAVGDLIDNVAIVHAQANSANAALAEKVTNAIDAVLTNACLESGRPLRGDGAPQSYNEAVAEFFFKKPTGGMVRSYLEMATEGELKRLEKNIFVTATAGTYKRKPSITIVDKGEGQSPDKFPSTLMSLNGTGEPGKSRRSRKADIKFLQGQFGMGGSAAYHFCAYQLVISKRNPRLTSTTDDGDRQNHWGFTVVRKRKTDDGHFYEYLAPVGATEENHGAVLSVDEETLALLPQSPPKQVPNIPYHDSLAHGTLVKLYEYPIDGTKSHITMGDSLKTRLELLMPVLALPVTAVEARDYKGKPGSMQTPIHGMHYRLQKLWETDQERFEGPPIKSKFMFEGKLVDWTAFVQKQDFEHMNSNGNKAVLIHLNGQTHADMSKHFLTSMKLDTLARLNTLILFVDCSTFSNGTVQELFQSSRDRFTNNDMAAHFKEALISDVRGNEALSKYQLQQRIRDSEESTGSQAAVEKLLDKWLKENPLLATFFGAGGNLDFKNPRLPEGAGLGPGSFEGKEFPTKFVFKRNGKTEVNQNAKPDSKARVQLVTDSNNDYFDRLRSPGRLLVKNSVTHEDLENFGYSLHNGALNLLLPTRQFSEKTVHVSISLEDDSMVDPLECVLTLDISVDPESGSGTTGQRQEPNVSAGLIGSASSVNIPEIRYLCDDRRVRDGYNPWDRHKGWGPNKAFEMVFENDAFIFFVNADFKHLIAYKNQHVEVSQRLFETRFAWGLALLSLAAFESISLDLTADELDAQKMEICEKITDIIDGSSALMLPMQDMMSTLSINDVIELEFSEED